MVDENKIDTYRAFYDIVVKFLKLTDTKIDWSILKKHQSFINSLVSASVYDYEVKSVQKELADFTKELTRINETWLICACAPHNSKIDLKSEIDPEKTYSYSSNKNNLILEIAYSVALASAKGERDYREAKRHLKNTYYSLLTVKKCIDNCGLLMDDICKRPNYMCYNFILIDKTESKKKRYSHYFITKAQLDDYVNANNEGQNIRIKGKFWEYSPKTDITVTATKFKNEEEIRLYKKLRRIHSDAAFLKCDMSFDITSQLIPSKISVKSPKSVKSINDLIKDGKIKEALNLALNSSKASKEDNSELTLLTSRFTQLEKNKRNGLISDNDYDVVLNKITDSLIAKVNEWEEE